MKNPKYAQISSLIKESVSGEAARADKQLEPRSGKKTKKVSGSDKITESSNATKGSSASNVTNASNATNVSKYGIKNSPRKDSIRTLTRLSGYLHEKDVRIIREAQAKCLEAGYTNPPMNQIIRAAIQTMDVNQKFLTVLQKLEDKKRRRI